VEVILGKVSGTPLVRTMRSQGNMILDYIVCRDRVEDAVWADGGSHNAGRNHSVGRVQI
jgi:hypothetical protein